ncbi:MAG: hypothetical protein WCB67_02455 [Solirubrobacteraceae bacterium]
MTVHSILPEPLTETAQEMFRAADVRHVGHGTEDPVEATAAAAHDIHAVALLGPYRSADVAEAVEASAPAGLGLLAPAATWAGITRDDEPGCDEAARHRGTVLRFVARDTEVARRIAEDLRAADKRALVIAGEHFYGRQLDGQLRLAGLPRVARLEDADLVVLAGLRGEPEIGLARASAPLPLVAFDGVQGAVLGSREVHLALPHAPVDGVPVDRLLAGEVATRHAATCVIQALAEGAADRTAMLATVRRLGGFDAHGDLADPPVWLWRADDAWRLSPDRPL